MKHIFYIKIKNTPYAGKHAVLIAFQIQNLNKKNYSFHMYKVAHLDHICMETYVLIIQNALL